MKLIVGLGNPGQKYYHTRHNIGFQIMDELSSKYEISFSHHDSVSEWGRGRIEGKDVIFLKPQTYMNLSGKAVLHFISYYRLSRDDLLVIYDDMDLPLGRLRIRLKGSSGGHRGMESIIQHLGSSQFSRLRIGIGKPDISPQGGEYVLRDFSKTDKVIVSQAIERSVECVKVIMAEGIISAMNRFNQIIDE